MLRRTLCQLGVWNTSSVVCSSVREFASKGVSDPGALKPVEFDPSEIKSQIPPQEPYTDREATERTDSKYDRVNPEVFVKHKETLDPRRYVVDIEQLENSALRREINPPGERYVSRLVVSMKSSSYSTLRSYYIYSHFSAECLKIETSMEPGKLVTGVYTVNRSVFVHGEHKDRFKRDVWNRKLILHDISGTTANVFLSYIQRNIPPGVTMSVTEERLTGIPLKFLHSFYTDTNSEIQEEVGEEYESIRSVVSHDTLPAQQPT